MSKRASEKVTIDSFTLVKQDVETLWEAVKQQRREFDKAIFDIKEELKKNKNAGIDELQLKVESLEKKFGRSRLLKLLDLPCLEHMENPPQGIVKRKPKRKTVKRKTKKKSIKKKKPVKKKAKKRTVKRKPARKKGRSVKRRY